MENNLRPLFFALDITAPWPESLPAGRLIVEEHRHMTIAFMGNTSSTSLKEILSSFPTPPFRVGPVGIFDEVQLYPRRQPRIVSWHVAWLEELGEYYLSCQRWLRENSFSGDKRPFYPHVTMARGEFLPQQWRHSFVSLPLYASALTLYESDTYSRYTPLWSQPFQPPFEEIAHTADLAYYVWAEDVDQLLRSAEIALLFHSPELTPFVEPKQPVHSVEDVVAHLNGLIRRSDVKIGSPFKAVTYCGEAEEVNGLLRWEMIIDG